jgi:spoIIIJ-associated protein
MDSNDNRLEIHAKDAETAIKLAVAELDVDRDKLDIIVLDDTNPNPDDLARVLVHIPETESHENEPKLVTVHRVLSEFLHHMEIDAKICVQAQETSSDDRPSIRMNIEGDELDVLIGRRGETLASLEYLIKLIVSNVQNRWVNIILDVDGYKLHREHQLKRLAQRMANQVLQFGRPIALEPMSSYERRIIHITLEPNSEVTTNSIGEGNQRKVNIEPSLLR